MLILTLFFILLGKPIFCQETPQLKLRRFETRNLQTSKLKMDFLVAHILQKTFLFNFPLKLYKADLNQKIYLLVKFKLKMTKI